MEKYIYVYEFGYSQQLVIQAYVLLIFLQRIFTQVLSASSYS